MHRAKQRRHRPFTVVRHAVAAALLAAFSLLAQPPAPPHPGALSADLPLDVDRVRITQLVQSGNVPEAHRVFDEFSWNTFVALNWPATADGTPDRTKTIANADAARVWEFYRESGTVFLPDGRKPSPWFGSNEWNSVAVPAATGDAPAHRLWMHGKGDPEPEAHQQRLTESIQAFTGPLVDQNGKWVRYEVRINKTEFDYVYDNALYNLEGQIAFTAGRMIDFPVNRGTTPGTMELKLAWKQLGPDDDPTRFLVRRALVDHMVADDNGNFVKSQPTLETMGLVGMHIATKTASSATWIWATFEHVDNVAVNDLDHDAKGRRLRPLFFNPATPAKPVNILPAKNAAPIQGQFTSWSEPLTTTPTQVLRLVQIAPATAQLNSRMREELRRAGSVFQYYELIGTQWPVEPSFPAFSGGVTLVDGQQVSAAPESIVFKTPGKITPTYLINSIMETFFQTGNQPAGPLGEDDRLPAGQVSDPNVAFGTESCVGCHFSAGAAVAFKVDASGKPIVDGAGYRVPVFGKNASMGRTGHGDYSWLLQMRAQAPPVSATAAK